MDKRELAENNVFFCDTCDRGFKTEDKYHEHVMGHEQVGMLVHEQAGMLDREQISRLGHELVGMLSHEQVGLLGP